jgi:low temperature requirement protein LtrA
VSTVLRGDEEQVRPLELFFDLVFVLPSRSAPR